LTDTSVSQAARLPVRIGKILLWTATLFPALVIGLSGVSKVVTTGEWNLLFASWGYPAWFTVAVGALEIAGALLMLVPRLAFYGGSTLAAIMLGAVVTLMMHPGSHLFRGRQAPMRTATPLVYLLILLIVAAVRWKDRARPPA
jgi:uncharacterized membrane protein YphA (DoxX/SURF4 family)